MADGSMSDGLVLTYDNHAPLELSDLSNSLQAVARRYARYAAQSGNRLEGEEFKLYVREIRPGSVVVELINWASNHAVLTGGGAAAGVFAMTQFNTVASFAKNLRDSLNWLKGSGPKPADVPVSELRDLSKIVEPIAKDARGSLSIHAAENSTVVVTYRIDSLEANAIQNRAEREIESRSEPLQKTFRQVLMYWQQASVSSASRSDRAVIEAVTDRPLKVIFDDESIDIKNRMISGQSNPFTIGFLVDVEVLTKQGRPVAYKVTRLYEVIDDDDELT